MNIRQAKQIAKVLRGLAEAIANLDDVKLEDPDLYRHGPSKWDLQEMIADLEHSLVRDADDFKPE